MLHPPTWETESPASSISWSMEKAPVLISSLSRAAAAFAERVCNSISASAKFYFKYCFHFALARYQVDRYPAPGESSEEPLQSKSGPYLECHRRKTEWIPGCAVEVFLNALFQNRKQANPWE